MWVALAFARCNCALAVGATKTVTSTSDSWPVALHDWLVWVKGWLRLVGNVTWTLTIWLRISAVDNSSSRNSRSTGLCTSRISAAENCNSKLTRLCRFTAENSSSRGSTRLCGSTHREAHVVEHYIRNSKTVPSCTLWATWSITRLWEESVTTYPWAW